MAIPVDPVANEKDGVKDHVVQHIAEKETAKEMWDTLKTLYQHTSMQRKC